MSSKILVVGSTGTVGRWLVSGLAQAGEQVKAATTNPARITAQANVEAVRLNLEDASTFAPALADVDRMYVLAPSGHLEPYALLAPFLNAATQDKQRKIIVQTASGVESSDEIPLRKIELLVERSGVPYVLLRPNWFMDNFHTYWLHAILTTGEFALPAGDASTSFIDARDIAAVAQAVLQTSAFDGQAFMLTGSEALTYATAATLLSAATGQTIRYRNVDDATFVRNMVAGGVSEAYAQFMAGGLFGAVRQGYAAAVTPAVQQITGHAPRTLAQYARDNAAVWAQPVSQP